MSSAPYPADTRAKGWRFELDYEKIDQSDTWALASQIPMAQPALLMMWLVAWTQAPCGSMPADENIIRAKCRIPVKQWAALRGVLMRGWQEAEDGRLYHPTITAHVLSMLDTRGVDRSRQEARQKLSQAIRARDGHACVYCGYTKYLTLDHLLPLTRGGDNNELNLATACRPCNSKKRDRTPEEGGFAFLSDASLDRWEKYKAIRGSPSFSAGEIPRNATGTGTGTLKEKEKRASAQVLGLEQIPEQLIAEWKGVRSAKRAGKLTQTIVDALHREAKKAGYSTEAAVRECVERGWAGFKADWLKDAKTRQADQARASTPSGETGSVLRQLNADRMTPEQREAAELARQAVMAKIRPLRTTQA